MERTRRHWFLDTRLLAFAVCLLGLGLVSMLARGGVQKPESKNDVTLQRPSIGVNLSLLPGKQISDLELNVRTKPLVKISPEVEFQDMAGGPVRSIKIDPNDKGDGWIGSITNLKDYGVGYIYVTVKGESGVEERHELRFATRGAVKNQPTVVYSVDGQFELIVLTGDLATDTRFLVSTIESPNPPLPAGVKLESGPFEIIATQQGVDKIKATVAIGLREASPNNPRPDYQVRWLNPDNSAWEVLPSSVGPDSPVAQAAITRLGTFVLTTESK